jgi:hypothetical protein
VRKDLEESDVEKRAAGDALKTQTNESHAFSLVCRRRRLEIAFPLKNHLF